LAQRKKLKQCSQKYFINEDLTKPDAKLFRQAREDVKAGILHTCWTKNGRVWAKASPEAKPFLIPE
jgi:hypothetical protein